MKRALFALVSLLLVCGCAGGPRRAVVRAVERRDVREALSAYERYRELDGPDRKLLAYVAGVLLAHEARSGDARRREAAIRQLALTGRQGEPMLRRVARDPRHPVARAKALEVLARRDRGYARQELYALTDSDRAQVLASAIAAVDVERDLGRLRGWLGHVSAEVRRAAALRLAEAAPDSDVRLALEETARVDPSASVRSACVRALGAFGPRAYGALRGRLGDPESRVRLAAVRALVRSDRRKALLALGSLLRTQPSPAGVEAARVIALTGADGNDGEGGEPVPERGVVDARAYLRRALTSGAPRIRSQAAIAVTSLPSGGSSLDRTLIGALRRERKPAVRLQLARALDRRGEADEAVREVLAGLLEGDGMPAVQAASMLAARGRQAGVDRLRRALSSDDAMIRRTAARAMAREAERPDAVRSLLQDDDPLVRIYAAGGILA